MTNLQKNIVAAEQRLAALGTRIEHLTEDAMAEGLEQEWWLAHGERWLAETHARQAEKLQAEVAELRAEYNALWDSLRDTGADEDEDEQ